MLVYLTAAVVSVPISRRLGLGSVLGYLVAGAIIGPSVLNLVGDPTQVMNVAEFGVVILLFLIGLEVRPQLLWSLRSAIFGVGGAQLVLTALAVAAATLAFGQDWRTALAIGAIVAMSSTAIVLSMLEEKGLRRGPIGTTAFGVLLFQDLAVIPLFALLPLLALNPHAAEAQAAAGDGWVRHAPAWAQPVAVMAAVGLVVGGGRYALRPILRFIASAQLREVFTASALLLVVAVAALMTAVGLSPALGAFLAGVMLADSEFRREIESDIEPFRGVLLGLFFITVGAGLDFKLLIGQPLLIGGLVLGLMALKAAVMFGVGKLFRLSNSEAAGAAAALCQGGEFAFVLIGFTAGAQVVGPELARLLTAVVAVSMLLSPLAFLLYERTALALRPVTPEREPDTTFDDGAEVIVAGYGRFGQIAGRLLQANGLQLSILDSSLSQIELLRRFGRRVNYGDASRLDLLRAAGADKAKLLIVAIDDREKALELVSTAKESFPHLSIFARAYDRRHAYELQERGADLVVRETYAASLEMGRVSLERLGFAPTRARRAADLFRRYDVKLFKKLAPIWKDEEGFVRASRQSQAMFEKLLAADLAALDVGAKAQELPGDADGGWETDSLYRDLLNRAAPGEAPPKN